MAGIKIVDLPPLGRDLASTDLLELSLAGGTGSRKITGQEIMNASKLSINNTPIINGTVGRVLFQGTGNVLQQSSSLFWDDTNNRLGIGTSSPTTIVDIQPPIGGPVLRVARTSGAAVQISASILSTGGFVGTYTASPFILVSNSAEAMRLFTTGNIGINTTTDAGFLLDVNGTARVQGVLTLSNTVNGVNSNWNVCGASYFNAITTNPSGLGGVYLYGQTISNVNSQKLINLTPTYNQTSGTASNTDIFLNRITTSVGSGTQLLMDLQHNSSTVFSVSPSGNVGIGTSSPVSRLHIGTSVGSLATGLTFGSGVSGIWLLDNTTMGIKINSVDKFWFRATDFYPDASLSLELGLSSRRWKSLYTQQITDNGSNVLIGTTTDAGYRLDVNGTARVSGDLTSTGSFITTSKVGYSNNSRTINFNDSNSGIAYQGFGGHRFQSFDGSSYIEMFTIVGNQSNLRIGINSTTPNASAILDVASTNKGFLPPRMTQAQRNAIASPAIGLEIYQTDATEGKYIYKSSGWTYIG